MKNVPEIPTTETLHLEHGISLADELAVQEKRLIVIDRMENPTENHVSITGGCSMPRVPEASEVILYEAGQVAKEEQANRKLTSLARWCYWKPRTNEEDWFGLETTNPVAAFRIASMLANRFANHAAEVASADHIDRYKGLVVGWTGGRNVHKLHLLEQIALRDSTLPLFIKNGLDGDVDFTLQQVNYLNNVRGGDAAPVQLMYRGGANATTPKAWEYQYVRALELTGGKMAVDTAHGSEMAFDPEGNFKKSVAGQMLAMEAIHSLALQGYAPSTTISESSNIEGETDPSVPLEIGLTFIRDMCLAKKSKALVEVA